MACFSGVGDKKKNTALKSGMKCLYFNENFARTTTRTKKVSQSEFFLPSFSHQAVIKWVVLISLRQQNNERGVVYARDGQRWGRTPPDAARPQLTNHALSFGGAALGLQPGRDPVAQKRRQIATPT